MLGSSFFISQNSNLILNLLSELAQEQKVLADKIAISFLLNSNEELIISNADVAFDVAMLNFDPNNLDSFFSNFFR
tara:strand:+ start:88 stop:315 length:228 start_codon:yes stop_codon:yes gene_type:complete